MCCDMQDPYIKNLRIAHDVVKMHKYRENHDIYLDMADSYYKAYDDMIEAFYDLIKSARHEQVAKISPFLVIHDMRAYMTRAKNAAMRRLYSDEERGRMTQFMYYQTDPVRCLNIEAGAERYLEIAMSDIHEFLLTGVMDSFHAIGPFGIIYEWRYDPVKQEYIRFDH